jgi:predicted TIM-barrel fold metal-dependent hydrolase
MKPPHHFTTPSVIALLAGLMMSSAMVAEEPPMGSTRHAPIIDVHLHVGAGRENSPHYEVQAGETPDDAFQRSFFAGLDAHGVVAGIVGGPATHVERFRQMAPDRLIAGVAFPCSDGLDPNRQRCFEHGGDWPDPAWLRAEAEAGRIGALGELYNVYAGVPVDGPEMAPYLALAAELDLVVLAHADSGPPPQARTPGCCPRFDGSLGHPEHWERVLERHPDLRVVLYHSFRPDWLETAIVLLDRYPNVMVETSPMSLVPPPLVHAALRRLIDAGHADRIVFGSDYHGAIGPSLAVIDSAEFLSEAQKQAIRYDNAVRFLRLADARSAADGEAPRR